MAEEKPAAICRETLRKGARKGQECGRATVPGLAVCFRHTSDFRAKSTAQGHRGGRGRSKKNRGTLPQTVPTLEPEPIRAGVWQDLIDRDVARADEARRSADSKEERAWLELVGKHMASACTDERERLKLHFDAPPLTVIFEGLADAPPTSFPPPPPGASDDPIAGVTPLPVRQGDNQ